MQILKYLISLVAWVGIATAGLAQEASPEGCGITEFSQQTLQESSSFGRGVIAVPRNVIRPKNLKWEIPIAVATAILITQVDRPADNRIQSASLERTAGQWSNVGVGMELASGALTYGVGCHTGDHNLRDTGFKVLAAMGAAGAADLVLKLAFNRQYPSNNESRGKFWGGGRSFPSGHAATSFAFASVVAHRYPQKKWVKWGSYALAGGVSLSRYPAKKHFTSDILVGATLGYLTGSYLASH